MGLHCLEVKFKLQYQQFQIHHLIHVNKSSFLTESEHVEVLLTVL